MPKERGRKKGPKIDNLLLGKTEKKAGQKLATSVSGNKSEQVPEEERKTGILKVIKDLKSQLESSYAVRNTLESDLDKTGQALSAQEEKVKELNSQLNSIKEETSSIKGFQDEINFLNRKLASAHEKLKILEAQLTAKENSIKDLQSMLVYTEEERSKLHQLQEMMSEIEYSRKLQREVTNLTGEKASALMTVKQLESEIEKFHGTATDTEGMQPNGRNYLNLLRFLPMPGQKIMNLKLLFFGFSTLICLSAIVYFFYNNEKATSINKAKVMVKVNKNEALYLPQKIKKPSMIEKPIQGKAEPRIRTKSGAKLESVLESSIKPKLEPGPDYKAGVKLEKQIEIDFKQPIQTQKAKVKPKEITEIREQKKLPRQITDKKIQQKADNSLLEKGSAYYRRKRWDKANTFLELYLKQNPSNTEAKNKLAKAKLSAQRAISLYKKAREKKRGGDTLGALELYRASYELYPELYDTWEKIQALKRGGQKSGV